MPGDARILVIGSPALGAAVARALPRCESAAAETLLSGLWTIGHKQFDAIVMSLTAGRGALRAIQALRQVAPQARLIVTCVPADEPRAREALQAGAHDYLLEPLVPEELAQALDLPAVAPPPPAASPPPSPSVPAVHELGEVLRNLREGLQPTLQRLATMLRNVFQAESATIQVGDRSALVGSTEAPVLQEPLRQKDEIVGTLALGRRAESSYLASDMARLCDYAHLIETIVAQLSEQARWQELAWRDDLSGLHNRRYFEATLDKLITQATAQRLRLTVILLDIDAFKTYNDTYGHDTGDALIREVAVLLTSCLREQDVVARYGGDEFAVILVDSGQPRVPGSQHPTDPLVLAERFQTAMRRHAFKCLGPAAPGPVTLSGGLACFPWDGKTRPEILHAADTALLTAKRTGKDRIRLAEKADGANRL